MLMFLIFLFGITWSTDKTNSIIIFKSVSYLLIVPILIVTLKKSTAKYLLFFLLLMTIVSASMTNILYFSNLSLDLEIKLTNVSPFINNMYYGTILSLSFIYFFINFNFKDKLFIILINLFSMFAIFTSMSIICNRSSLIGMLVAISIYLWFRNNTYFLLKRLGVILVTVLSLLIYSNLINPGCGLKFFNMEKSLSKEISGKRTGTSLGCRLNYIENSIELIKENPIIGVGTGDSLYSMKNHFGEDVYLDIVTKPCYLGPHNQIFYFDNHNMYLTMLMLFGPLGLIVFIYFFYEIFRVGVILNSWELKSIIIIVSLASIPITLFYTSSNFVLFFSFYVSLLYIVKKDSFTNENS